MILGYHRSYFLIFFDKAWREKWGFHSFDDTPKLEEISHALARSGQQLHAASTHDKQGRKLLYKFSAKLLPSDVDDPKGSRLPASSCAFFKIGFNEILHDSNF
jgi:hypothetical protein